MNNKYRIVKDRYCGFEVQIKYWWFPVWWYQCGYINTHSSIEDAEEYINTHKDIGTVVKEFEVVKETVDDEYLDRIGIE